MKGRASTAEASPLIWVDRWAVHIDPHHWRKLFFALWWNAYASHLRPLAHIDRESAAQSPVAKHNRLHHKDVILSSGGCRCGNVVEPTVSGSRYSNWHK